MKPHNQKDSQCRYVLLYMMCICFEHILIHVSNMFLDSSSIFNLSSMSKRFGLLASMSNTVMIHPDSIFIILM